MSKPVKGDDRIDKSVRTETAPSMMSDYVRLSDPRVQKNLSGDIAAEVLERLLLLASLVPAYERVVAKCYAQGPGKSVPEKKRRAALRAERDASVQTAAAAAARIAEINAELGEQAEAHAA